MESLIGRSPQNEVKLVVLRFLGILLGYRKKDKHKEVKVIMCVRIWMCMLYMDVYAVYGCVCCIWMCMLYMDVYAVYGCVCCIWMYMLICMRSVCVLVLG